MSTLQGGIEFSGARRGGGDSEGWGVMPVQWVKSWDLIASAINGCYQNARYGQRPPRYTASLLYRPQTCISQKWVLLHTAVVGSQSIQWWDAAHSY
jgi:hypothetical protein